MTMFYGLGVIGFFAVTALPLRLWVHLRASSWALGSTADNKIAYFSLAIVGAVALALAGSNVIRVGRCLLGFHCSANAAGGWMALGSVGFWYLAYEILAFAIRRGLLKKPRVAT